MAEQTIPKAFSTLLLLPELRRTLFLLSDAVNRQQVCAPPQCKTALDQLGYCVAEASVVRAAAA